MPNTDDAMSIDTPYNEFNTVVQSDWIDYNGHLNVAYYHVIFDLAAKPFFNWLGFTPEVRSQHNISTFALETHMSYLSEVKVDEEVRVEARVLDVHPKRFHFYQEMYKVDSNTLTSTHESLGTVVNMEERKSAAMPDALFEHLLKVKEAHSTLPSAWQIGHVMSVNPRVKS